ncbi:MAG: FG-GAP-like repeat-containing protein, partial [Actinomycetota bacterium]
IHAYVGGPAGSGAPGYALGQTSVARPDVVGVYPSAGPNTGFDFTFDAPSGSNEVYLYAINIGPGENVPIGTKHVVITDPNPIGAFDSATAPAPGRIRVRGWAYDPNAPTTTIAVHIYVGGPAGSGAPGYAIPTGVSRPDVKTAHPEAGPNTGFDATLKVSAGSMDVYAYGINSGPGSNVGIGAKHVVVIRPASPLDSNGDAIADLFVLKVRNAASAHTEPHLVAGPSFDRRSGDFASPLEQDPDGDLAFTVGDVNGDGVNDLVALKSRNTGSGSTEVHVITGPSFDRRLADLTTPIPIDPDGNFNFTMGDVTDDGFPDLIVVKSRGTSSGSTEVQVVPGPSFSSIGDPIVTPIELDPDGNFSFTMGDVNADGIPDLVVVKSRNTASGSIEVHVTVGPNFDHVVGDYTTPLSLDPDSDLSFLVADLNHDGQQDLMVVAARNTGSHKLEVHAVAGPTFSGFLSNLIAPVEDDPNVNFTFPDSYTIRAPGVPQQLSATPGSGLGEVHLNWQAAQRRGARVLEYTILRGDAPDSLEPVATVNGDVLQFEDAGLLPLHTYFYAVTARNIRGLGNSSDTTSSKPFPWVTGLPDVVNP